MLQVKTKLQEERDSTSAVKSPVKSSVQSPMQSIVTPIASHEVAKRSTNLGPPSFHKAKQPTFPAPRLADTRDIQTRVPAIIGEATFRGMIAVDGLISGQPAANGGGTLTVKQRSRSSLGVAAELDGEIRFVDMVRVGRHIAGSIYSEKGTLIVDTSAVIDADVEVGIAVIGGTVNGNIVAHQRVEIGPSAKIYGNIWTRSLAIQNGAIFEGVCQMLEDTDKRN
jgi:cytoskeletal protein CcmA (bactofilin family)